ncbi:hypothetical protein M0804_010689 [Polistes exclamans]|nr:hypothetical protein M0804_010689 [Polistes exclamans]
MKISELAFTLHKRPPPAETLVMDVDNFGITSRAPTPSRKVQQPGLFIGERRHEAPSNGGGGGGIGAGCNGTANGGDGSGDDGGGSS